MLDEVLGEQERAVGAAGMRCGVAGSARLGSELGWRRAAGASPAQPAAPAARIPRAAGAGARLPPRAVTVARAGR
jgi:hypothetical protein